MSNSKRRIGWRIACLVWGIGLLGYLVAGIRDAAAAGRVYETLYTQGLIFGVLLLIIAVVMDALELVRALWKPSPSPTPAAAAATPAPAAPAPEAMHTGGVAAAPPPLMGPGVVALKYSPDCPCVACTMFRRAMAAQARAAAAPNN